MQIFNHSRSKGSKGLAIPAASARLAAESGHQYRRPMERRIGQRGIRQRERAAMGSANRLKLGLFGANCSSGRAVTMVPERWSGRWSDCLALAKMADEAGIEFMLPIGRW